MSSGRRVLVVVVLVFGLSLAGGFSYGLLTDEERVDGTVDASDMTSVEPLDTGANETASNQPGQDETDRNETGRDGDEVAQPGRNGTGQNGTEFDGTQQNETSGDRPPQNGTGE